MPRAAVEAAEGLWHQTLRDGVQLPNGEVAQITPEDLYHLVVDHRIWRKPERIERLLRGVFALRTAELRRRRALSQWEEDGERLWGYAILEPDGRVRALHVTTEKKLLKMQFRGEPLWPR